MSSVSSLGFPQLIHSIGLHPLSDLGTVLSLFLHVRFLPYSGPSIWDSREVTAGSSVTAQQGALGPRSPWFRVLFSLSHLGWVSPIALASSVRSLGSVTPALLLSFSARVLLSIITCLSSMHFHLIIFLKNISPPLLIFLFSHLFQDNL